jgi:hypothetical protein
MFEAGQTVCMLQGGQVDSICVIDRVTPTMAIIKTIRFNKETGYQIGDCYPHCQIREVTQKDRDEIRRRILVGKLNQTKWGLLSLEALETIWGVTERLRQSQQ